MANKNKKYKRSIEDVGRINTSFNYINSNVDTRSDTTRKGYHEGKMSSVQSNSYHPFIDMYNAIDYYTNATNPNSPRYNPNLVTGIAPNITIKDYTKLVDYLNNINSLQKSINADKFVKFLSDKTGKSIKRVKIKDTKIGDVYSDGYSYVDDTGREIAHIAGNKRNNKVFVESSYVDPEFRSKGLGKQMYFDFNKQVFNKYGTTLHSSPYQHQTTLETSPGSGVFISPSSKLWRGLKQNNMATIQGKGLDKYYVMDIPSNIITKFKNGGIYKRSIEDAGKISDEQYYDIIEAETSVPYDWQRNKKANGGEIKYNTTSGGGYIQPMNVEKFKNYIKGKIYNYVTGGLPINVVRNRIYNNLFQGYDPGIFSIYDNIKRVRKAVVNNEKEKTTRDETVRQEIMDDLFAEYLQIPENKRRNIIKNRLTDSPYKPSISKNNTTYKRINHRYVVGHSSLHPNDEKRLVDAVMKGEYSNTKNSYDNNKHSQSTFYDHPPVPLNKNVLSKVLRNYGLGVHTISRGKDNKGEYVSYYDLWDMAPTTQSAGNKDESMGIGKPIHIYDRLYLDDYYGVPIEHSGGYYIPEVIVNGNRKKHVIK